jgi:hypothetical protein
MPDEAASVGLAVCNATYRSDVGLVVEFCASVAMLVALKIRPNSPVSKVLDLASVIDSSS